MVVLVLLAVAGAALGFGWRFLFPTKPPEQPMATEKVVRRNFTSTVLATGAVKPQVGSEVRVGSRLSGRVERLYANVGDVVKKGQTIAELEKDDLAATVAEREAEFGLAEAKAAALEVIRPREIEKAESDMAQCQATATLARKTLEREEELVKNGVDSPETRDQANERVLVADAKLVSARKDLELVKAHYIEDVRQARAEAQRAKAAADNAKIQLSYATIKAPIAGVIASVATQEGETVAAGLNAPTFVTIINLDRLQVDAWVDEVDIGKIAAGQKAVFTVDSFPSREFNGKVVAIYPKAVITENVVNYDVVLEIVDKNEGLLRPEMTTSVTIQLAARENVLAVPAKAVKRDRGKTVAYVLKAGGEPERREIKVGWKDGSWLEVAQGLAEGETVLVDQPKPDTK
jgi:macrolide-specific efflux system membrane fusion protein